MAKTVDRATPTFDAMTSLAPQALRDGLEKSVAGLAEATAEGKRNIEALTTSAGIAAKGVQALGAETTAYYKAALESYVAQAKAVGGARSYQALVDLQSAYAKTAIDAFLGHVNSASALASATIKDTARPLNERATAMAKQFKAAR